MEFSTALELHGWSLIGIYRQMKKMKSSARVENWDLSFALLVLLGLIGIVFDGP